MSRGYGSLRGICLKLTFPGVYVSKGHLFEVDMSRGSGSTTGICLGMICPGGVGL